MGNFPGVTVDKKEGSVRSHPGVTVVDLPGIYSLSPYTSEEVVSRDFLLHEHPAGVINIVDATTLERNLYLCLLYTSTDLEVPTLDGKVLQKIPAGTASHTTFRLQNRGIQHLNSRGRGDQYVKVTVEVPKNLTNEQKERLMDFDRAMKGGAKPIVKMCIRDRQRESAKRASLCRGKSQAP